MRPVNKPYDPYKNLGYWFLFFIVLIVAGFYRTYFEPFPNPRKAVIHIHFVLVTLWVILLIVQPFLIKYKKFALHRKLGKASYIIVPAVLVSAFLMLRFGYYAYLNQQSPRLAGSNTQVTQAQLLSDAAAIFALPLMYIVWMALFYSLAIIHRRRSGIHARYMLATALTLLGPTIDRIMFVTLKIPVLFGSIPAETLAFAIADLILVVLIAFDLRHKKNYRPLLISLAAFIFLQVFYFTLTRTEWWLAFMNTIMGSSAV
jgi:hypothetical protein